MVAIALSLRASEAGIQFLRPCFAFAFALYLAWGPISQREWRRYAPVSKALDFVGPVRPEVAVMVWFTFRRHTDKCRRDLFEPR